MLSELVWPATASYEYWWFPAPSLSYVCPVVVREQPSIAELCQTNNMEERWPGRGSYIAWLSSPLLYRRCTHAEINALNPMNHSIRVLWLMAWKWKQGFCIKFYNKRQNVTPVAKNVWFHIIYCMHYSISCLFLASLNSRWYRQGSGKYPTQPWTSSRAVSYKQGYGIRQLQATMKSGVLSRISQFSVIINVRKMLWY